MFIHVSRNGLKAFFILAVSTLIIGQMNAPTAQADDFNLAEQCKLIKPSVVKVYNCDEKGKPRGTGSGFLVNEEGMIATNYHVIEGAKQIMVQFPGYSGDKQYKSVGYVGFLMDHDIAIVKLNPEELFGKKDDKKDKKTKGEKEKDGEKEKPTLKPLPMAKERPEQGEKAIAYGSPWGVADCVAEGYVSGVRQGKELRKSPNMNQVYKAQGYNDNAYWIHITVPITHGNSGGPLVNTKNEVIGLNTWGIPGTNNTLNFAISIEHVRDYVEKAGSNIQPYSTLPPPRHTSPSGPSGDGDKTLAFWKKLNRAKNELDKEIKASEKKLRGMTPVDPRNRMKGQNQRNKVITGSFLRMSKAYDAYANTIGGLDNKDVDFELIELIAIDTVIARKIRDHCRDVSNDPANVDWSAASSILQQMYGEIDTQTELLRVNLGLRYEKSFPTQAETADEDRKNGVNSKSTASSSKANAKRAVMRTWTSKSGKYKIRAKCVSVKNGSVELELSSGKVITVKLEDLSEADKRFLASTG